ncbi:hypothetical protein DMENIID0001_062840 [Sergentomyia squamirostris]
MKSFVCVLFLVTLTTFTFANYAGHYVPRAAFTVDENGRLINYLPLHPETMNRFKRSAQVTSSSSSSASSSSSGGPVYFGNPYGGSNFGGGGFGPGFAGQFGHQQAYFPQNAPGQTFTGVSSSSQVSSPGGLNSRFGGDEAPVNVQHSTSTITGQNGQFTQTQSHLGEDGKVHFTVHSGKF